MMLFLVLPWFAWAEETTLEGDDSEADDIGEVVNRPVRVGRLDEEQLRQLAIADEVKEHEVIWLEVSYPNLELPKQVLALEQYPRFPKGKAQGAIILLHDKEQHADWPFLIRPLRMELPNTGWYTLAVNLPYDKIREIPTRSIGPKQIDEIETTEAMRLSLAGRTPNKLAQPVLPEGADAPDEKTDEEGGVASEEAEADAEVEDVDIDLADKEKEETLSYREQAQFHMKAAVEHVAQKGYRNIIVIGYRAGADIALDYVKPLASKVAKQGFGLVLVDPKLQLKYQVDLSLALGENFRAPVLDIVNGSDLDARLEGVERDTGARIANAKLYRQLRLNANESGAFQQTLIRRVRAWLERYAPGVSATQFGDQAR